MGPAVCWDMNPPGGLKHRITVTWEVFHPASRAKGMAGRSRRPGRPFLFLSTGAHALISLPQRTNAIYNTDLGCGINRFRWFEYALSSSVMVVLIATLFGIYDIASFILIFLLNASMNLVGLVIKHLNSGRARDEVKDPLSGDASLE